MNDNDTVGNRIARARLRQGWNQTALARALSTTQTCISYWENGTRDITVTNLLRIATALNVPPADLLPTTTPKPPPLDLTGLTQDLRDLLHRLEAITYNTQEPPTTHRPLRSHQRRMCQPRPPAETPRTSAGTPPTRGPMEDTYTIIANKHPNPTSSIQYQITVIHVGHTQAETAADVPFMTRDYLDTLGLDGNAPLTITWLPEGTRTNHPREHPTPPDM